MLVLVILGIRENDYENENENENDSVINKFSRNRIDLI
jgi:hypothetical protein